MEIEDVVMDDEEYVEHIGILRKSGRYPWGSGQNPFQRSKSFKAYYQDLKNGDPATGRPPMSNKEIADLINAHLQTTAKPGERIKFATTNLIEAIGISTEQIRNENIARAKQLQAANNSNIKIGEIMGTRESTVRGWLKESDGMREGTIGHTAERIRQELESKPYLDVGKGQNLHIGVSPTKFNLALAQLRDLGYEIHPVKLPQAGTGEMTNFRVLTKEGVPWTEAKKAVYEGRLSTFAFQSDDGGKTFTKLAAKPISVDLNRVDVLWGPQGGKDMDGVLELRRGVEDISLGANKYAQVRVAVNKTHYLKGMAIYADDLPAGVDIRFNTNKPVNSDKLAAMKPMKIDQRTGKIDLDAPFGSTTYQKTYLSKDGKEKTSALNMVYEEGKWDTWSRNLSSQMLSKQSNQLASTQLGIARKEREDELNKILRLTNPLVREKLLKDFAEAADSSSVHLKAAQLPRQASQVLLPIKSLRRDQIYAPNFEHGEKVVLVRHPHGGPFEIPELTVNNNNRAAWRIMKGAKDAVGIHPSVAEQLSGADFDGDTVVVIPNNSRKIKAQPPLAELRNFEPKIQYAEVPGMTKMNKSGTQLEMGKISNLITDMTIMGAPLHEISRAIKHSMVVIDAEKHVLNYKQSEKDNDIKSLKATYQGKSNAGAATIISRASSKIDVPHQKPRSLKTGGPPIDPVTGEKKFAPTGKMKTLRVVDKKTGAVTFEQVPDTSKVSRMAYVDDARRLLSGGKISDPITPDRGKPMEKIYADHANAMKDLANQARREMMAIRGPKQSSAAKYAYAKEAASLDAKLKIALRNAPLERRAQSLARGLTQARIDADPSLDKDAKKRIQYKSLEEARQITDARKQKIGDPDPQDPTRSTLTAREWEAIQAGAISSTKVREILANANMDRVRELAQPRARTALTPGQMARARQMESSGRSPTEIADALGLPRSTVVDNLKAE